MLGVVLAGGNSLRMGQDKALMRYHDRYQYEHVYNQLISVGCSNVIINSNSIQDAQYEIVPDNNSYLVGGPLLGLLTLCDQFKETPVFLMGIDYPNIKISTLQKLMHTYEKTKRSVCFWDAKRMKLEPLISIFSEDDLSKIDAFYMAGGKSIYDFLNYIECVKLEIIDMFEFENKNSLE